MQKTIKVRNNNLRVKLSFAKHKYLKQKAKERRLTLSDYLRRLIMTGTFPNEKDKLPG